MATQYEEVTMRMVKAEEKARKGRVFLTFAKRHPERVFTDADYQAFLDFFGDNYEDQLAFNLEGLEQCYADETFRTERLTQASADEIRDGLIDEILDLLSKARSREQLDAERKRLAYVSVADLQAQKARLTEMKQLERGSTREQLHQASRAHQRSQFAQPALPAQYTAQVLKKIDSATLRKLIRFHGHLAVTERLREGR